MGDFLARLAERTLRTVPVAQPVLASRFAPGQVMAASILETEAWSTVAAQDVATAQRAETGDITLMQGRQATGIATARPATTNPVETSSIVGGQMANNEVGMTQARTDMPATSATTTHLPMTKNVMPESDLALAETSSEVHVPQANTSGAGTTPRPLHFVEESKDAMEVGAIHRPLGFAGEGEGSKEASTIVAGNPELPIPLAKNPTFVEEPHEREIELSLPSPESEVINSLSTKHHSSHRASASGMPLRQNEPVALEQEEAVSFQPLVKHNTVVPLGEEDRVGASFERDISLQPEETLLPLASIPVDFINGDAVW